MNQDARSSWNTTRMDLAIAAGTTIALLLLTVVAREDGSPPVDAGAFVLSGLIGVALLWRRRYPRGVAVISFLFLLAYHTLDYPALGNLPLAPALMSAAYHSATVTAVVVAALEVAGTLAWFVLGESRDLPEVVNFGARESALIAAVILSGWVLRSRRELATQTRERLRLARADQEARTARRMAEERIEIAREIHDVVSHTVAVIGVQAKVALDTLRETPDEAEDALKIINQSTRDATAELRATVGVLRSQPSLSPAPRLDQLQQLVESVSRGGLTVELITSGEQRDLSGLVELVAYRVVQEALTNVVRHADATKAIVEIDLDRYDLRVSVSDDGVGDEPTTGHGIAGMQERVEAIGGHLSIGRSDLGGLSVVATLPVGEQQ